jgi:hypothetical protein
VVRHHSAIKLLLGVGLLQLSLFSQTRIDLHSQGKNIDFSDAPMTRPVQTGPVLPPSCMPGELFFNSSSSPGANIFGCTAPHIWSQENSLPPLGTGTLFVKVDGTNPTSTSALNFLNGAGIITAISQVQSGVNIQLIADTTFLLSIVQARSGSYLLCDSIRSGSNYTCAMKPTLSTFTLVRGAILSWVPDQSCSGSGLTLTIDSLGPFPISKSDGSDTLQNTDCPTGALRLIWFDGVKFRILV